MARTAATTRSTLPQNYAINAGTLWQDFETFADWSRQSAGGSIADETTIVKEGSHSLKITAADASNCFADKTLNETLTNAGVIGVWINIPSKTGLTSVAIYLSSVTNYSKYFLKTINAAALHEGWNFIEIARDDWTNSGGEAWTNTFVRIRVRINASSGTPSCYFDSIYKGIYKRPKVLVTFDDSWDSQYLKAYSYMNSLGLKGTIYVIGSKIGTTNYCTLANLSTMYSAGWDFGNHGDTDLTTLSTQAEQKAEIAAEEAYLTNWGFTRARNHYAYPNGGYDDNAKAVLGSMGYLTARTILDQHQSHLFDERYLMTRYGVYNTTTVANVQEYIDSAIARGNSLWLNFHIIVDATADTSTKVLTADFNSMMDYLKTKKDKGLLDVVTISEWYNGLTSPRTSATRSAAGTRQAA